MLFGSNYYAELFRIFFHCKSMEMPWVPWMVWSLAASQHYLGHVESSKQLTCTCAHLFARN